MSNIIKTVETEEKSLGTVSKAAEQSRDFVFSRRDFAKNTKVILRDMNNSPPSPTFTKYTREEILGYLEDPAANETNIRDAVIYMYGASARFYRIIQYFVGLTDLAWFLAPYNLDVADVDIDKFKKNRLKTLKFINSMNLKTQGKEILTVCMREDIYYVTCWVNNDNVTMQQLPSEYCTIASIEENVCNVTFNFSYFDRNAKLLPLYPPEFTTKYNAYKRDKKLKYQDLDSPNSFAIKCNKDIKNYAIPPLAGVLTALYDLADYQDLKLTKTELENYALLVMKLGINADGEWTMDFNKAKDFWSNLGGVLPSQVGSVLSPMEIEKIDFNNSSAADADKVAEAENTIFTEAGVSSLLFNNTKASANALALSIKADQALVFGIVQSIEDAINRLLHRQSFAKNFKITFIDSSPFNRKEMADQYLKAATYGLPTISAYCATVGLNPDEVESMNFLEVDTLNLASKFRPLQSSNTIATVLGDEAGRPEAEEDELTDAGEVTREQQ